MKNKILLAFIVLFLLGGFLPDFSLENLPLKKDIVVPKNETQDNIISFGGDVLVEGRVKEDVVVLGGSITISGEVSGSVVGIGTTVTLKSTAVVKKDVVTIGGTLEKEPGCIIEGDTVYFKSSEIFTKFLREGFKGIFSLSLIPLILIFKLISVFIWFIVALVIAALFPNQLSLASNQIRKSLWPVFWTGVLALIIFTGLVIISIILCFVLIGIPLLLGLIVAAIVIKIFGRVVLFYFFGESLSRAFNMQKTSPLLIVILGLILVSFISFFPLLGFLFSFCLTILGWGVVIRTKFGTSETWSRKRG